MNRRLSLVAVGCSLTIGVASAVLVALYGGGTSLSLETRPETADADASYEVTLSPCGTVRFAKPPERVVTLDVNYEDMLVALGRFDRLIARGPEGQIFDAFYAQLPGLEVGRSEQRTLYGAIQGDYDKELLYELAADVHHIDPVRLEFRHGWARSDVEEIARNVAPFFANRYSRENDHPGSGPYEYYTVWELSKRVAQVYRVPEVIARLQAVYDQMVGEIGARLPPAAERRRVGVVHFSHERQFLPHGLGRGGFASAQYRAIGARDAFADDADVTFSDHGRYTWLDIEGMLAVDPDVIIVPYAIYPEMRWSYDQLLEFTRADPLGQRLRAARTGRIHPGGAPMQGPIYLLFQLEMAAKQIYPEVFGPYRDDQRYPRGERLFDRERVARILLDARH